MKSSDVLKLTGSIIVTELVGSFVAKFTAPAISSWYLHIAKPPFTPPNWVFAPVWAGLYALMGVAVFLVWREGWEKREVKIAVAFYVIQLVLNAAWSLLFFNFRRPDLAFLEIVVLIAAILGTAASFCRVSMRAAMLLAPYILWVCFAAALNAAFWALNGL